MKDMEYHINGQAFANDFKGNIVMSIRKDGGMNEFEEENELEIALHLAANEPASRPDFFKLLLTSPVFIPYNVDEDASGRGPKGVVENPSIISWKMADGVQKIPFFTSLTTLRQAVQEETGFIVLLVSKLFEMTKGHTLILNPEHRYAKEFLPREIKKLLEHVSPIM